MKYTVPHQIKYDVDWPDLANVERLDKLCLPMLHVMMRNGIWLNRDKCKTVDTQLAAREADLRAQLHKLAGRTVNPESGDQVAKLLYQDLWLHKQLPREPELTPSGKRMTTSDEVLSAMVTLHPAVKLIIDARECNTLRTTFTSPLLQWAAMTRDGRIRPLFTYTSTRTGRLACEDPNLMNIPIRAATVLPGSTVRIGQDIRNCFQAQAGLDTVLVSCDLSQIEMRKAAHLSKDPNLMRIFWDGLDIHTRTASAVFRVPADAVTKLQRMAAKNLGFGILYRQTALGLQAAIFSAGGPFWSEAECDELIANWYVEYCGVYSWACLQDSRMRRYGMTWDFVGRYRLIPEARSVHERVRQKGFREGGNQPIQSGAAAIIKLAMGLLMPVVEYYANSSVCMPLLQVHDELLFECGRDIAGDFSEECRSIMANCVNLDVPLDASADVAAAWGDMK